MRFEDGYKWRKYVHAAHDPHRVQNLDFTQKRIFAGRLQPVIRHQMDTVESASKFVQAACAAATTNASSSRRADAACVTQRISRREGVSASTAMLRRRK
jgi:hypothetical protein